MIARATVPTFLVTVQAVTWRVTRTLPGRLLRLGLFSFRASQVFWSDKPPDPSHHRPFFFTRYGLMRLACLLAVFVKPTTIPSVMGLEGPTRRLAPSAVLGGGCLLGGWSSRTSSIPFLAGYTSPFLGGCASLGLDGSGFLIVFLNKDLLNCLKIVGHWSCWFWYGLVVQLIEVPPVNVTGGQYDTSQCGVVEWYIHPLGGSGSNRQWAVLQRRQ